GVSAANVHASADGTTTVKRIWRSPAPRNRAEWTRSASTARAPWKVLKNTMKKTIVQASTIFASRPKPKIIVTSGTSAMRGDELKATMYGSNTRARRSWRPSTSPATKPVDTPTTNPQSVDSTVESAICHRDNRTSPELRYTKRRAMADGRLMKNGSIQYRPGVRLMALIRVSHSQAPSSATRIATHQSVTRVRSVTRAPRRGRATADHTRAHTRRSRAAR